MVGLIAGNDVMTLMHPFTPKCFLFAVIILRLVVVTCVVVGATTSTSTAVAADRKSFVAKGLNSSRAKGLLFDF